jgi:hypothetical protein
MLRSWDISDWRVFEYGGGMSTVWWRHEVRECITVDTSLAWAKKMDLILETDKKKFIEYPLGICETTNELFDCIIIDSEPTSWRDECTGTALKCLKEGGIIIIDNWLQDTIEGLGSNNWIVSRELLKNYEGMVYKQTDHADWKTACWVVK